MAEPKNGKTALVGALALLIGGAGTWLGGHAISPAQAQASQVVGLATAAQVAALEAKVDKVAEEVMAIKLEQARQQGARDAVHRPPR